MKTSELGMNPKDFEKIYNKLLLPLGMYSLRIVGNVDDAQDIVQNAFTNTWNLLDSIDSSSNLKSYLYAAVRNGSLKRLAELSNDCPYDISTASDVSEEDIDTSERDARLWSAINNLPERCRQVFLLCKRDGLSHREVSERLGISVKTIENQITKAMKALRKAYGISDSHSNTDIYLFFLPLL